MYVLKTVNKKINRQVFCVVWWHPLCREMRREEKSGKKEGKPHLGAEEAVKKCSISWKDKVTLTRQQIGKHTHTKNAARALQFARFRNYELQQWKKKRFFFNNVGVFFFFLLLLLWLVYLLW